MTLFNSGKNCFSNFYFGEEGHFYFGLTWAGRYTCGDAGRVLDW